MERTRVLALVQAGGAGSRMDVLTRERAKPALPFAGVFRLVDFPLSSLAHSGIDEVWLSVQFQGATIDDEVANGRPWDLDRSRGGLRLLMPQEGTGSLDEDGFARGNADELYRVRDQIAAFAPDVLLVMSADHVYRLDFADVVAHHLGAGAECTVVTSEVPLDEAGDHAVVEADADGRVTAIAYKPDEPTTTVVATEIFAYAPGALAEVLDDLHRELGPDAEAGDTGLGDFGDHLLPRLVERGRTVALAHDGYWRDLGQPHLYLRAHQDFLTRDHDVLAAPGWPILTRQPQRAPARIAESAALVESMVSPGALVAGRVVRSVLGPGVVVEAGAEVVDSVVFDDTVVRRGALVAAAIIDSRCEIGADARVGDPDADLGDSDQLTLVGRDSTVAPGTRVSGGARLEPGSSA